jgi:hypothetical protein
MPRVTLEETAAIGMKCGTSDRDAVHRRDWRSRYQTLNTGQGASRAIA